MPKLTYHIKAHTQTIDLNLEEGDEFFIGRGENADLTVIDREMSRIHAKIYYIADTYTLVDCNSINGVIVNDVSESEVVLNDLSEFTLGNTIFTFHLLDIDISSACTVEASLDAIYDVKNNKSSNKPKNMRLIGEGLEFNGIKIEQTLNRRGIAHTFRGYQADIARTISIKFLQTKLTQDPEYPEYFNRIMKYVVAMNAHPLMAKIFEYGNYNGFFYLVGEWVDGSSAERILHQNGPLNPKQVVDIALAASEMIKYLKESNTVNGQIKPSNIVINHGHPPRFLCGGLMNLVKPELINKVKNQLEFPYFSSPEQIDTSLGHITSASDVYSLGATLYYLLSGEPVFDGNNAEDIEKLHLIAKPTPLVSVDFKIPNKLKSLIMGMLEKKSELRPSIEHIIEVLESIQEEVTKEAKKASQHAITTEIPRSKHKSLKARRNKVKAKRDAKAEVTTKHTLTEASATRIRKKKEKEKQFKIIAYICLAFIILILFMAGVYIASHDPAEKARKKTEALNKQHLNTQIKTTIISQEKLKELLKNSKK